MAQPIDKRDKQVGKQVRKLPEPMRATMWKPGQSGNPAGRPKGRVLSEAYRDLLDKPCPPNFKEAIGKAIDKKAKVADILALVMASHTIKGNVEALVELRKATEGDRVTAKVGNEGGEPIRITLKWNN